MTAPRVAVVVPTYRRAERVGRLVAALERQSLPVDAFEVVVVDDCSDDDTAGALADLTARTRLRLRVLRTPRNAGPAVARNLGWRASTAPLVAFTDDDCVPQPGWLAAGVAVLEHDGSIGIVQGRTELPPGRRPDEAPWLVYREIYRPTAYFEGCNLFLRRDALEATGGFDEGIGWFGEETAMGWRALELGWCRAFADAAVVVHDVEDRGLRWFVEQGRLEANLVEIARRHPAIRGALWRRWAVRPTSVAILAAVVGLALAPWRRVALVLALPYLRLRGPGLLQPGGWRTTAEKAAVDAVIATTMVRASLRHRTVLL